MRKKNVFETKVNLKRLWLSFTLVVWINALIWEYVTGGIVSNLFDWINRSSLSSVVNPGLVWNRVESGKNQADFSHQRQEWEVFIARHLRARKVTIYKAGRENLTNSDILLLLDSDSLKDISIKMLWVTPVSDWKLDNIINNPNNFVVCLNS